MSSRHDDKHRERHHDDKHRKYNEKHHGTSSKERGSSCSWDKSFKNDHRNNCLDSCGDIVKAWVQHLLYTRLVVIAFFKNDPELNAYSAALLSYQQSIGNYIASRFGVKRGEKITALLNEHIMLAVQGLTAVRSGNAQKIKEATDAFYANADQIGVYLDKIYHKEGVFRHHMKEHIDTLLANILAFQSGRDYAKDLDTLNTYVNAGIDMAFAFCQ